MKKLLVLIPLFIIEHVLAFENVGDYKKLNFVGYLDYSGLRIIDLVDRTDSPFFLIKENTPFCKSGNYYGYVDNGTKKRATFAICTRAINFMHPFDFGEYINYTLRHEAVHAAQFCKGGDYSLGVEKWRFEGYPKRMVKNYYTNLSPTEELMELEAFALENDPYFVESSVRRFCF